ncbi:Gfo/Idh/MocA family protein [Marmoricola sp. RAF53]|uniref:Gfo/Idh/MocA family protein n=1 Tax=Marmoricola sp. RAF53 TaxID=3233059 RepID=UPI003F96BB77
MAVRFGLVGTGHWARTVHAVGLAAHPEVDLVGVWGRDPGRTGEVADAHGAAAYADFDALVADVDALAFAVPPDLQAELALRAAEAGRHLFLEKPVSLDPAAADAIVAATEERGLATMVFLIQRFVPAWEEWLTEVAATGPLGGRADWLTSQGPASPYAGSTWRREHGALWDVGPHMLSQLIAALGPVTDVVGARGREDLVHLVLTHEGGRTSRMSLSLRMPDAARSIAVELWGEDGWHRQPDAERDTGDAYARALGDLVANIGSGETAHRCDVRFGRDLVHVLARCEAVLG